MTRTGCQIVVIDREEVTLPESVRGRKPVRFIRADAADGLAQLRAACCR